VAHGSYDDMPLREETTQVGPAATLLGPPKNRPAGTTNGGRKDDSGVYDVSA